ncbi:hypothetical protein [Actinomycetospora sp. NBC_00405]|uniref:hypothetical protein n=1 Tax=Actinomycetospora sp. NBC_00405 TaxID=2975952 RepID=UPI002E1AFD07
MQYRASSPVACRDWARRERIEERARVAHVKDVDAAVAAHIATGEWPEPPTPRTAITSWSRKSRASMVRRLNELDYTALYASGRLPTMVTLTYPSDWLTVVPTGSMLKRDAPTRPGNPASARPPAACTTAVPAPASDP